MLVFTQLFYVNLNANILLTKKKTEKNYNNNQDARLLTHTNNVRYWSGRPVCISQRNLF